MNQTITITTQGIAEKLGEYLYRLANFDASQFSQTAFSGVATINPEIFETMLASESVLARDWNTPEEDAAWSEL
jgi:hypothetical protein